MSTHSISSFESKSTYRQEEQLLKLQRDILEIVATSNDHEDQLIRLCYNAEAMLKGAVASIMLIEDSSKVLMVRSAPSIPEPAIQQLNGLEPGPQAGSCGTAVFCETPIFVKNTLTDGRWAPFRQFALDFDILACWSHPIKSAKGETIGSFALTSFETRKPNLFQKNLLSVCASLAGVILHREIMEQDLQKLAYFDSLTNLPNRDLLNQRIDHAIENAHRHHSKLALLYIDVDNFKFINDSYGHLAGDKALSLIANVMSNTLQEGDTLARTGGDEFIILLEDLATPLHASNIAQQLLENVAKLQHQPNIDTTLSIGISIYPDDAKTHKELMRNADTAMYAAKSAGKNNLYFYRPELTEAVQKHITIINELKHALANDQLVLHFQPIYNANLKGMQHVEALIRWQHPEQGLLAPFNFIRMAEQHGLINQVTDWVVNETCKKIRSWLDNDIAIGQVSINLTADDITADLASRLQTKLEQYQLPAKYLSIEITESILLEHGDVAINELNKLRDLGIEIALDDFGTGYSSLSQLHHLPIDKLKIDRSFIKDIPSEDGDVVITKLIISMGQNLNLEVIAEGVETQAQAEFLQLQGCDYLQGFYLAKPMTEQALLELLTRH